MNNDSVRKYAKYKGVTNWMIANKLNKSEATITRMFRNEFTDAEKEKIMNLIDEISKENK